MKKNKEKPDFYLTSSEGYGLEDIRSCFKIKRLSGNRKDGYMLCDIDPPIIGQPYGLGQYDITQIILANRHKGCSLFPITEWPTYVHVARPLIDNIAEKFTIENQEIELIGWAEIYKHKQDIKLK